MLLNITLIETYHLWCYAIDHINVFDIKYTYDDGEEGTAQKY